LCLGAVMFVNPGLRIDDSLPSGSSLRYEGRQALRLVRQAHHRQAQDRVGILEFISN